jgi:hypothetical protein
MPDHKLHITLDELVFGEGISFPEIHKKMDSMQPYLQSAHRKYYHDMQTVYDIYNITRDRRAAISAYLHIWLDNVSDEVGQEHAIARVLKMIRTGEIRL